MQRQRSADLLAVASRYGLFPIVLETYREVMRDVFDMPALREVLTDIRARRIRVVSVESRSASPFASSLLFDYVGSFMYEGDAPLAERRAQALALDRELLAELLGTEELRELIDPEAVADLELELQLLAPRPPGPDHRRGERPAPAARRPADRRGRGAGERHRRCAGPCGARDDAARDRRPHRRGALDRGRGRGSVPGRGGASPPRGVAEAHLQPVADPLDALLARWARTHGPFTADAPAERWGVARAAIEERLSAMCADGRLLEGAFRPGGAAHEYTDPDVLRQLRRRSLARLRREVEPWGRAMSCSSSGLAGVAPGPALDAFEAVAQLEGPAAGIGPRTRRFRLGSGCTPRLLDEPGASGEVVWIGRGSLGRDDGRVALYRRDRVDLLASAGPVDERPSDPIHDAIRQHLQRRGASFFPQLRAAGADARNDEELLDALWDSYGPAR